MASVRVRTLTGLFFAALVVAALFAAELFRPGIEPWAIGFVLALLVAFEVGRMGRLASAARRRWLPIVVGASALCVVPWLLAVTPTPTEAVLVVLGLQVAALAVGTALGAPADPVPGERELQSPSAARLTGPLGTGLLAAWIGPPLASLGFVHATYGTAALAVLLVLSKIGDTAGYFVGRAIGKSHPFPSLSPGKTTAGCVASLLAGTATGAVAGAAGFLPGEPSLVLGGLVGAAVNVAAQAADLAESFVKRTAAVKDSSGMAGASGGVLDVVDSLLFSLPTGLVLFALIHS